MHTFYVTCLITLLVTRVFWLICLTSNIKELSNTQKGMRKHINSIKECLVMGSCYWIVKMKYDNFTKILELAFDKGYDAANEFLQACQSSAEDSPTIAFKSSYIEERTKAINEIKKLYD